jgi:hypothetical protein
LTWLETPRFLEIVKQCAPRYLLAACSACAFALLRQQAYVIHASRAHGVDCVFNGSELRTRVCANINGFAGLVSQLIANQTA